MIWKPWAGVGRTGWGKVVFRMLPAIGPGQGAHLRDPFPIAVEIDRLAR
jgi:hypothetical protein